MRSIDVSTGQYDEVPEIQIERDRWDVFPQTNKLVCGILSPTNEGTNVLGPFSDRLSVVGESPIWSNNGRFVAYPKLSLPDGLIADVKRGKSPDKDVLFVLRKDGTIDVDFDVFNIFSPVVEEVSGQRAQQPATAFKNRGFKVEVQQLN